MTENLIYFLFHLQHDDAIKNAAWVLITLESSAVHKTIFKTIGVYTARLSSRVVLRLLCNIGKSYNLHVHISIL